MFFKCKIPLDNLRNKLEMVKYLQEITKSSFISNIDPSNIFGVKLSLKGHRQTIEAFLGTTDMNGVKKVVFLIMRISMY